MPCWSCHFGTGIDTLSWIALPWTALIRVDKRFSKKMKHGFPRGLEECLTVVTIDMSIRSSRTRWTSMGIQPSNLTPIHGLGNRPMTIRSHRLSRSIKDQTTRSLCLGDRPGSLVATLRQLVQCSRTFSAVTPIGVFCGQSAIRVDMPPLVATLPAQIAVVANSHFFIAMKNNFSTLVTK